MAAFEQRAAYFDGDPTQAQAKGVNILERGRQVHFMAEFQALLDFPPAPKLNNLGRLDPGKATESEMRGQALFSGKAQCATCHIPPYYTDNLMHNLRVERFYNVSERMSIASHAIQRKTSFPCALTYRRSRLPCGKSFYSLRDSRSPDFEPLSHTTLS